VNACPALHRRWSPVFSHVLGALHTLEPIEPSPQLVNSILTATLGPQSWRNAKRWLRGLQSRVLFYSVVSVCGNIHCDSYRFRILLEETEAGGSRSGPPSITTPTTGACGLRPRHEFFSDMRVVYRNSIPPAPGQQLPTTPESTVPQSSPNGKPGRTDKTNPSSPRQQNRADELGRNLQVLARRVPRC